MRIKKTVHFQHSKWGSRAGIVQTETISFNRFSLTKQRIFYQAITPTKKLGVIVNRLGAVKAFLYRDSNV